MFFWSSFLIAWIFFLVPNVHAGKKVSCFYNSSAHRRKGEMLKFTYEDIVPALPYCTHLVYMFAGIDEDTYEAISLDPSLDNRPGLNNFRNTAACKPHNPDIKMLLSIGGFQYDRPQPYFKVLETNASRAIFIKSLATLVEMIGFDGADLAWPFPTHEENNTDSEHYTSDPSVGFEKKHKAMFACFVAELRTVFRCRRKALTLTVLPHVKADEFIDFDTIKNCVDHIHLMTYDYKTPFRNPHEADYSAPLYYVQNRNRNRNVEQTVDWWIKQNVPAEKLVIAIPTFGRSWRIRKSWRFVPPVKADGAAVGYIRPFDAGILPYYEICRSRVRVLRGEFTLKKIRDKKHHLGTYAYRRADKHVGLWVSFEEPITAAEKAKFAKRLNLGGVAVVDLSLDDSIAHCHGETDYYPNDAAHYKYPILRAAKHHLVCEQ